MAKNAPGIRYAEAERETNETVVRVVIDLDGGGRQDVTTGIGFLDHMLCLMAFHGQFDLGITAEGDLQVDDHHTVEDVAMVLGMAIRDAIGDGSIIRYSDNHSVMDDALVLVALDFGGRSHLSFDANFRRDQLGQLSTENVREFFSALCRKARIALHIREIKSENDHHLCEAIFKGFGRALHEATRSVDRRSSSTKGKMD